MIVANDHPHRQTSNKTRQRVIVTLLAGMSMSDVALAHSVKLYTVDRIWKKFQAGGGTDKDKVGGQNPKK